MPSRDALPFAASALACALLALTACEASPSAIDAAMTPITDAARGDAGRDARAPTLDAAVDDASAADVDAARTDAAPALDAGPISDDCRAYCECFERDCAGIQDVPGGLSCPAFCATFTHAQWDCRISHCRLVVPEHNPNHCMHAAGIDQCL